MMKEERFEKVVEYGDSFLFPVIYMLFGYVLAWTTEAGWGGLIFLVFCIVIIYFADRKVYYRRVK